MQLHSCLRRIWTRLNLHGTAQRVEKQAKADVYYSGSRGQSMLDKAGFVTFVPVKKMDRAINFYTEGLGGKLKSRGDGDMKDSFASVKIGRHEFWLITPSAWEK